MTRTADRQAGLNRRRFNVECLVDGAWRVADMNCLTPGHADSRMAFLQKQSPEIQFRVVPVSAFIPHRPNYR